MFAGAPVGPEIYRSFGQDTGGRHLTLVLREWPGHPTTGRPRGLIGLEQALPGVTLFNYRTANDLIDRAIPAERLASELLRVFAVVALLVSLAGLGVMVTLVVRSSRRAIAIRTVLGARPLDIVTLVCRQAAWSLAIGLGAGLGVSFLVGRALLAYGHWSAMPSGWISAGATGLLAAGAVLAAAVPTADALRTDAAQALRGEG